MCIELKYPNVLIVNQQSLKKNNATGITLRSLWKEWPRANLMEVYFDEFEPHLEDDNESINSFLIPTNFLNRIAHSKRASKLNSNIKWQCHQNKTTIKTKIRQAIVLGLDLLPVMLPLKIKKKIANFKPDVIYTLGSNVGSLRLAYRLSKVFDVPILMHYMDNWPECLQWENNPFCKFYRLILNHVHKKCLRRCKAGLAISSAMSLAYSKKFKIPFFTIMNSVDVDEFHAKPKLQNKPVHFVYAGGLHLNRWQALRDIGRALLETDEECILHIYTSTNNAEMYQDNFPANTVFHSPVSRSGIIEVYGNADVLVHIERDNPLLHSFFKFSISTKIPEYLSSGRAILFYGPKNIALYRYLDENNAAFVADSYDSLLAAIKAIFDGGTIPQLLINAERLARTNHSISLARETLRKASLLSLT